MTTSENLWGIFDELDELLHKALSGDFEPVEFQDDRDPDEVEDGDFGNDKEEESGSNNPTEPPSIPIPGMPILDLPAQPPQGVPETPRPQGKWSFPPNLGPHS